MSAPRAAGVRNERYGTRLASGRRAALFVGFQEVFDDAVVAVGLLAVHPMGAAGEKLPMRVGDEVGFLLGDERGALIGDARGDQRGLGDACKVVDNRPVREFAGDHELACALHGVEASVAHGVGFRSCSGTRLTCRR